MIITNPSDNKNYILVQDAKDQLYLISDIGRILWKRPLDGRIMGTIQQFLIKGKAQNILLFNTVDKIYQVNIDGNNVGNFPVLLPSHATTSISLFDFKSHLYRGKFILLFSIFLYQERIILFWTMVMLRAF